MWLRSLRDACRDIVRRTPRLRCSLQVFGNDTSGPRSVSRNWMAANSHTTAPPLLRVRTMFNAALQMCMTRKSLGENYFRRDCRPLCFPARRDLSQVGVWPNLVPKRAFAQNDFSRGWLKGSLVYTTVGSQSKTNMLHCEHQAGFQGGNILLRSKQISQHSTLSSYSKSNISSDGAI